MEQFRLYMFTLPDTKMKESGGVRQNIPEACSGKYKNFSTAMSNPNKFCLIKVVPR